MGENGRETLRSRSAQGTNPITAAWITKGDGYKHPSELVALEPRVSARGYRIPALCVRKIRSCAGRVFGRGARLRLHALLAARCYVRVVNAPLVKAICQAARLLALWFAQENAPQRPRCHLAVCADRPSFGGLGERSVQARQLRLAGRLRHRLLAVCAIA